MKLKRIWIVPLAVGFCASAAPAQETNQAARIDQLQQQLRQLQEAFEKVQQQHRQQLEMMQKEIDALRQQQQATPPATAVTWFFAGSSWPCPSIPPARPPASSRTAPGISCSTLFLASWSPALCKSAACC